MKNKGTWPTIILIIFYGVGIIGITNTDTRFLFASLTPYNLILTFILFAWANNDYRFHFFLTVFIIFICGWSLEWAGVHTGMLFGEYKYGDALGYKFQQVPLIIGLNWFLLSATSRGIVKSILKKDWMVIVLSSLLMTLLDILIEPVATKLGFWTWKNNVIPVQNYIMWFIGSVMMQMILQKSDVKLNFKSCGIVFLLQILFFALLNFILK